MFDLLIIGGGPAGYIAAERAGRYGLKVVVFEKKAMGGVCLHEGCIPAKTLLHSAKIYENVLHAGKYGIETGNVNFDFGKIVSRKKKIVRKLVLGVEGKMKANNVIIVNGEAVIRTRSSEGIEVVCNETVFFGKNLLICTGSEASVPSIPGLQKVDDCVVTNREILELEKCPQSLIVIGGGVIGMEFASFFNSLGTRVTVIEMMPEILGNNDYEISAMLRDIYSKKGVEFHLNANVVQIDANKVIFKKEGQLHTVQGEKILLSVGRTANIRNLGLENINVETTRNGIKVDERMRTNVPGVFAAGDVTGFSLLAHTAIREGEVVVNNLTGGNDRMRYNAIPSVVYTNPEVAAVGETEESAKAKAIPYRVAKLPMTYAGRFVAENEGGNGICKVLVGEKQGEVIGVHMLGNPCSEIVYGACIAIEQELTLKEMKEVVLPHPSVSEIIKEVIFKFE